MDTDPDFTRLKITRRAHRGQLTKLVNRADVITKDDDADGAEKSQMLLGLVDSMSTKLRFIQDIDNKLFEKVQENDLEDAIIEADDYAESMNLKIRGFHPSRDTVHSRYPAFAAGGIGDASIMNQSSSFKRRVNLPKLQLPTFDGNLTKWTTFHDAFTAAVDADENLDEIQKFQYLRAHLTGEAARTVEGLPLTSANYAEALTLLIKRYGQPHKIIACLMRSLWELPKPTSSTSSIKNFYDLMESYIRGLRSLGKTENSYGDLLVPVIFDKLPSTLKTQISRDHGDEAWTLTQLKDAIYTEIQASEAGMGYTSSGAAFTPEEPFTSTTTFHVNTKRAPGASLKTCAYCKGPHASTDCMKVVDKNKRYEIAKRDRLCSAFAVIMPHVTVESREYVNPYTSNHKSVPEKQSKSGDTHVKLTPTSTIQSPSSPILLKTASSIVRHDDTAVEVSILLDEGASRSFITEDAANCLNIRPASRRSERINLSTFGADSPQTRCVDVVDLQLDTMFGEKLHISALVVPKISSPVQNFVPQAVMQHDYLRKLPLAKHVEQDTFQIDLLIGADYYWTIVQNDIVRGCGPTAVSSKLGYLLSGPSNLEHVTTLNTMIYKAIVSPDNIDTSTYWDLETIGIKETPDCTPLDQYEQYRDSHNLRYENGKYTASLPWKSNHLPLPSNYMTCERRTRAMIRHLSPDIRMAYQSIIMEQLSRGFIERVYDDDITQGHYIPHHAVYKASSTTPIRIVYDCSCKSANNPSLNDCLDTGPSMINDLVEILLRFRFHPVALVSDIEKAFLNIRLDPRDRDYTKFLWISDPDNPNSTLEVYRFQSILFGSVSSPFILNAVIKTLLDKTPNVVAQNLQDNIYVDNLISGTTTESEAIHFYNESVNMLKGGGFNLRSWSTNNANVRKFMEKDQNQEVHTNVKVLGMLWDTVCDTMTFPVFQHVSTCDVHTKREVVRITSSLFDPIGLLSPVHIQAKIFIQKLWRLNLTWDELLPDALINEWSDIRTELDAARHYVTKRHSMSTVDGEPYELHVFADASCSAYGAVIYLKQGSKVSFIIAKSRVKPLKDITIPKTLLKLKIDPTTCILWSDSQIVIHWILSDKRLPLFIENRVKVIREGEFSDIRYCPTKENPADLLTRGISYKELEHSELWLNGPIWLSQGDWPICDIFQPCENVLLSYESSETNNNPPPQQFGVDKIIDITRYDSLGKLLRVTGYVLRFIALLQGRSTRGDVSQTCISLPELHIAETLWVQAIQANNFTKEIQVLNNELKTQKDVPLVRQLKLYIDSNGIVRCGGRFQNANIEHDAKYPVLLPRRSYYTELVVKKAHSIVLHAGLGNTVIFIRQHYWIPRIRQVVKSILRTCVTCRKVAGNPYQIPVTPPMPRFRVEDTPPFTASGVDFTGALYYRTPTSNTNKAYVCLFTCAVTRAVHLELVLDMTTDSFLRAFRRFTGRRSLPSLMVSDNGSTFISAAGEIRDLFSVPEIMNYMTNRNVKWTFIPKRAPWFGGFYERLIGITKMVLKKTLGRSLVSLDELNTLIIEVEAIVNDRPLTYLSMDPLDLDPLTPSQLLCGRTITTLPYRWTDPDDPEFIVGSNQLQKRSQKLDELLQQCWRRWRSEYLPALREAHAAKTQFNSKTNKVKVGDVVLVHSDTEKRSQWPLAIVTRLNTGNDGLVRSVEIKTKHGVSNRPIAKLYPLEVTLMDNDNLKQPQDAICDEPTQKGQNNDIIPVNEIRPRREAAIRANETLKRWSKELLK